MTQTSAPSHRLRPAGRRADHASYLLASVVFFGLAVRGGVVSNVVSVTAGIVVLIMVVTGFIPSRPDRGMRLEAALAGSVLVFAALGVAGYSGSSIGPSSALLEKLPGVIWAVLAVALFVSRRRDRGRRMVVAVSVLTVVFSVLFGINHVEAARGVGFDVLFLHKEAAEAMAAGQNPYTDAVAVDDGAPTADPGDQIEGYVYPPVTAVAYAVGEWVWDDPRYASLVSWVGVLVLASAWAIRRPASHLPYLVLLLAALPGWPLVLRAAWTEPFSLLLLAVAATVWPRPAASGLWLGLGLASKQYFVVAAPYLLVSRARGWRSRALMAVGAAGLMVGIGLIWDPGAFWSAAVQFHTSTPPRPDSSNLVGLLAGLGVAWDPPAALPLAVGLVVATLASMRSKDAASAFSALALALAASFLVSSQAFANYWLIVMGVCLLALAKLELEPPTVRDS